MMMHRRGVLRAISVAVALAWWPVGDLVASSNPDEARSEALLDPTLGYRIVLVREGEEQLWAPRTGAYIRSQGSVTFYADQVAVDRRVKIVGAKLVSPSGEVISERSLIDVNGPLVASAGDKMNLSYRIVAA